jgi:hypothetical protein
MADKPSYLGLLNAIAVAEAEAEVYLNTWAEVTPDEGVRKVLRTVALREGEHAKAFAKRIAELGYEVRPPVEDGGAAVRLGIAGSADLTDAEKFEHLGLGDDPEGDDVFAGMFRDRTIDIQTGALLGRYIAEERDSARLLCACRAAVSAGPTAGPDPTAAQLDEICARLDKIEKALVRLGKK